MCSGAGPTRQRSQAGTEGSVVLGDPLRADEVRDEVEQELARREEL
jgi:hypothetical protein